MLKNPAPYLITLIITVTLLFQCTSNHVNYNNLKTYSENGFVNAVVEVPAGTNLKLEYNPLSQSFEPDQEEGSPRKIQFLPYPGNYGFIPNTQMPKAQGGDGDALDVLIIAESLSTGTVMEVKPIGILLMEDEGEKDHKVIAIPADSSLQIIDTDIFMDFMIQYDAAKQIIEDWFLNYKGWGKMSLIMWEDEKFAIEEIKKAASFNQE